jgi:large subunit ribosomal protein L15
MNLKDIYAVRTPRRRKRRVGRGGGSGVGGTSGRGHKGAHSRAGWGGNIMREGGQMPLVRRVPKRGFNNANFRVEYAIVNLRDLAELEPGTEVGPDRFREMGLVKKRARLFKVLAKGDLSVALTISAHRFSTAAREKIEAAGGTAVEIK